MHQMITLKNGVRLLIQPVAGVRSAALGIWVGTGSRHEKAKEGGAAHFLEHMAFKGTTSRTAAQLAQEMDEIGGQINAFTTKECTCFYGRVLDTHLMKCADILCDMLLRSTFCQSDVEMERGVILEEIGMYKDNPEDLCSERLATAIYRGSSLARPILGKASTLHAMTGESLATYQKTHYRGGDIVVALAGSFSHDVVDFLADQCGTFPTGKETPIKPALYTPAITLRKKSLEQNHLTLAFPSLPYAHPQRFVLQTLSTIVGGGMSSRLWQEIREQRGLCYTIYSYGSGHQDTGMFGIYTALSRETEGEALRAIAQVLRTFVEEGVSEEELSRAREQSKSNVILGLESTQAHMSQLGRGELLQGEILTADQIIQAYDTITPEQVQSLAREIFNFDQCSLSAVGRVEEEDQYRTWLA